MAAGASGGQEDQVVKVKGILSEDLTFIRQHFHRCSDLAYRTFSFESGHRGALVFIDGLVDDTRIEQVILEPLKTGILTRYGHSDLTDPELRSLLELSINEIQADQVKTLDLMNEIADSICLGDTALFM
ncbi:hypothetical protein AWM70_06360 [Paenibacillus yonginensis]|uniref:Uncharacterized protein n=1 Tax=Paenibacillus yonginensis TaxID=1462996 RepID=A0A1B1MYK4_9BACL|nr:hypothetical protein AWM70_06360 [Paenibacillus yonginensis]